jgi:hypothetical protein
MDGIPPGKEQGEAELEKLGLKTLQGAVLLFP